MHGTQLLKCAIVFKRFRFQSRLTPAPLFFSGPLLGSKPVYYYAVFARNDPADSAGSTENRNDGSISPAFSVSPPLDPSRVIYVQLPEICESDDDDGGGGGAGAVTTAILTVIAFRVDRADTAGSWRGSRGEGMPPPQTPYNTY